VQITVQCRRPKSMPPILLGSLKSSTFRNWACIYVHLNGKNMDGFCCVIVQEVCESASCIFAATAVHTTKDRCRCSISRETASLTPCCLSPLQISHCGSAEVVVGSLRGEQLLHLLHTGYATGLSSCTCLRLTLRVMSASVERLRVWGC